MSETPRVDAVVGTFVIDGQRSRMVCEEDAQIIERNLRKELAEARKDAEKYRLISGAKCNSLTVSFNEHAASYVTAKDWIENCLPSNFERVDPEELQRMKDSNSIWQVQIYPNTPIGFNVYYGATLDAAITAAPAA